MSVVGAAGLRTYVNEMQAANNAKPSVEGTHVVTYTSSATHLETRGRCLCRTSQSMPSSSPPGSERLVNAGFTQVLCSERNITCSAVRARKTFLIL